MIETLRTYEYGISATAFLLLILYHFYLYRRVKLNPLATSPGFSNNVRKLWVQKVMADGKDILAIQTLRNTTMASTFLASTAILISLGIFNLAVTADKQGELSLLLGPFASDHPGLWTSKLVLLGIVFLITFFNFTLSIRYYNHSGFLINLPADDTTNISPQTVVETLNRGGFHYTLGMRGYYLSMPIALWLFGPVWLLFGTLLLIAALFHLDRVV